MTLSTLAYALLTPTLARHGAVVPALFYNTTMERN